jgi:hypothetical protein
MKILMTKFSITITILVILVGCSNITDNSKIDQNSGNEIIENYSSPQKRGSISGSGQKVVPVKLMKGVAIFELSVENNFDELSHSLGQVMGSNISLLIKRSDGEEYSDNINVINMKYNGSISFTVPRNDTYLLDITASSMSKWVLKIK